MLLVRRLMGGFSTLDTFGMIELIDNYCTFGFVTKVYINEQRMISVEQS